MGRLRHLVSMRSWVPVVVLAALVATACSSGDSEAEGDGGDGAAVSPTDADDGGGISGDGPQGEGEGGTFVWPVVATLTGNIAPLLDPQKDAIAMAVEEINAEGGVKGRAIEVRMEDDGGAPEGAITAFRRLVPDALFVMNATPTNSATGTAPLAVQENVVLYGGALTQPPLVRENRPTTFTGWPDAVPAYTAFVDQFVEAHPEVQTLSFVWDEQDAAANFQGELLRDNVTAAGLTVNDPISVTTDQVDFVAEVDKLASEDPDAVILGLEADTASKFLVQMSRAGIGDMIKVATRSAWSSEVVPRVAGEEGLANLWTVLFFSEEATPEAQEYGQRYTEHTGRATDDSAAFAYEGVYLLVDLIEELGIDLDAAGSDLEAERQRLIDGLNGLSDYTSVLGNPLSFEDGLPVKPAYIMQGDASGQLSVTEATTG